MRNINKAMLIRKIGFWLLFTVILLIVYYIGYYLSMLNIPFRFIIGFLIFSFLITIPLLVFAYYIRKLKLPILKIFFIWVILFGNTYFAFLIGLTIPMMETINAENMGIVMIPLLIVLNYIITDRLFFYLDRNERTDKEEKPLDLGERKKKHPVIEYNGKKYHFSIISIIFLAIGAPLSAWLIYIFFDNPANYWLHEIVVKQTAFFLKLLFNMNVEVRYFPNEKYNWGFYFPSGDINGNPLIPDTILFETFCTGIQAICVFAGIIIFTPHSKDPRTKKDIIWRKTKSLIISSLLFYIVNIIRMLIQLQLYYIGYNWNDIHVSISAASSFIAAIIVILLHQWIPEFIISIIYVGTLVSEPIKSKRKEIVIKSINQSNKVNLNSLRKAIGMKSKNFNENFTDMIKNYNFIIEDQNLIVPIERKADFFKALEKKFRIESK